MLFGSNGMGGFWLQRDQVKLICNELNIDKDQIYYVSKRMTLIAYLVNNYKPEEGKRSWPKKKA